MAEVDSKHNARYEQALRLLIDLRKDIIAAIRALPDNPRIQRLGDSGFSIRWRDLGTNWSVRHHDFAEQYNSVCLFLENADPTMVLPCLQTIVERGYLVKNQPLHPEVVAGLKSVLEK